MDRAGKNSQVGPMNLTRRESSKLLLAGVVAPCLPAPAFAASSDSWARRFQRDLDQHLVGGCDGELSLLKFGMSSRSNDVWMACVVQLDWPPGTRRRRFDARGGEDEAAYSQLLNLTLFSFAKAWPGCVV